MGEAKEEAARTIIEFVKAPDMFQVLLNFDDLFGCYLQAWKGISWAVLMCSIWRDYINYSHKRQIILVFFGSLHNSSILF